jgi:aryl-alcohol dehydrogenase-like predicted oxidoreductase
MVRRPVRSTRPPAATEVTWNLLEPSVASAAAEAAQAGWAVLIKEALANGRLAPGGDAARPGSPLTRAAATAGMTADAVAIGAALAQPWATLVLSGAVSAAQLQANLAALRADGEPEGSPHRALTEQLAESPAAYWSERSARPWS